jgi:hypothetical protein
VLEPWWVEELLARVLTAVLLWVLLFEEVIEQV